MWHTDQIPDQLEQAGFSTPRSPEGEKALRYDDRDLGLRALSTAVVTLKKQSTIKRWIIFAEQVRMHALTIRFKSSRCAPVWFQKHSSKFSSHPRYCAGDLCLSQLLSAPHWQQLVTFTKPMLPFCTLFFSLLRGSPLSTRIIIQISSQPSRSGDRKRWSLWPNVIWCPAGDVLELIVGKRLYIKRCSS